MSGTSNYEISKPEHTKTTPSTSFNPYAPEFIPTDCDLSKKVRRNKHIGKPGDKQLHRGDYQLITNTTSNVENFRPRSSQASHIGFSKAEQLYIVPTRSDKIFKDSEFGRSRESNSQYSKIDNLNMNITIKDYNKNNSDNFSKSDNIATSSERVTSDNHNTTSMASNTNRNRKNLDRSKIFSVNNTSCTATSSVIPSRLVPVKQDDDDTFDCSAYKPINLAKQKRLNYLMAVKTKVAPTKTECSSSSQAAAADSLAHTHQSNVTTKQNVASDLLKNVIETAQKRVSQAVKHEQSLNKQIISSQTDSSDKPSNAQPVIDSSCKNNIDNTTSVNSICATEPTHSVSITNKPSTDAGKPNTKTMKLSQILKLTSQKHDQPLDQNKKKSEQPSVVASQSNAEPSVDITSRKLDAASSAPADVVRTQPKATNSKNSSKKQPREHDNNVSTLTDRKTKSSTKDRKSAAVAPVPDVKPQSSKGLSYAEHLRLKLISASSSATKVKPTDLKSVTNSVKSDVVQKPVEATDKTVLNLSKVTIAEVTLQHTKDYNSSTAPRSVNSAKPSSSVVETNLAKSKVIASPAINSKSSTIGKKPIQVYTIEQFKQVRDDLHASSISSNNEKLMSLFKDQHSRQSDGQRNRHSLHDEHPKRFNNYSMSGMNKDSKNIDFDWDKVPESIDKLIEVDECNPEALRELYTVLSNAEKPEDITEEFSLFRRQLRGLLNKMTPNNHEFVYTQIANLDINSVARATELTRFIFEKANLVHKYMSLYADLLTRFGRYWEEQQLFSSDNKCGYDKFSTFLATMCQDSFDKHIFAKFEPDPDLSDDELYEAEVKHKQKVIGNLRFICFLAAQKHVTPKICCVICDTLTESRDPTLLEALSICLENCWLCLCDNSKYRKWFTDDLLKKAKALSDDESIELRTRFLLLDAIEKFERTHLNAAT